ncbi:MAG TPA: hypothetical protein VLJ68_12810 [Chitinophagaceae bacterium]|nr:hypothetical protein [Chitinophagaceae bacterium]
MINNLRTRRITGDLLIWITVVIMVITMVACKDQKDKGNLKGDGIAPASAATPTVFDKLLGTWASEDGKNFERWIKNEDGTFTSVVFHIKEKDTIYTDQTIVYREKGKWVSENTIAGQNEGQAVKFTEAILTENSIQFSNPAHDFPTDVNYKVRDANTVNAFIAGPNNKGGKDTIPFNYTRVK